MPRVIVLKHQNLKTKGAQRGAFFVIQFVGRNAILHKVGVP